MDQRIDLDASAREMERFAADWRAAGAEVGPITWADGQTTVNAITPDRSQVRGDYSVGIRAKRGEAEAAVILHAGGWCDFEYWSGDLRDDPILDMPGWENWLDVNAFRGVLERLGQLLIGD